VWEQEDSFMSVISFRNLFFTALALLALLGAVSIATTPAAAAQRDPCNDMLLDVYEEDGCAPDWEGFWCDGQCSCSCGPSCGCAGNPWENHGGGS
jgi:hypothetical protein